MSYSRLYDLDYAGTNVVCDSKLVEMISERFLGRYTLRGWIGLIQCGRSALCRTVFFAVSASYLIKERPE